MCDPRCGTNSTYQKHSCTTECVAYLGYTEYINAKIPRPSCAAECLTYLGSKQYLPLFQWPVEQESDKAKRCKALDDRLTASETRRTEPKGMQLCFQSVFPENRTDVNRRDPGGHV